MRLHRLLGVWQMLLSRRLEPGSRKWPSQDCGCPKHKQSCFGWVGDSKQPAMCLCPLLCLTFLNPSCTSRAGSRLHCVPSEHQTATHTDKGLSCSQPLLLLVVSAASATLSLP